MRELRPESQWAMMLGTDLASQNPKDEGRALTARSLASWLEEMESLITCPPSRVATLPQIPRRDATWLERRLDGRPLMADRLAALERQGILVTTVFEDNYPRRLRDNLGKDAPPVLFYAGNLELADMARVVGFVGSREATLPSLDATRDLATSCVEAKVAVCSGGARGVDREAEDAVFQAKGMMVLCPAEGLSHVVRQRKFRTAILDHRLLCLSTIDPEAPWLVGNAMDRNELIYASSTLVCVMHAREESGGTWGGATEALLRGRTTVASWKGPGFGPANQRLVELGALPIESRTIRDVISELRRRQATKKPTPGARAQRQAGLLDSW